MKVYLGVLFVVLLVLADVRCEEGDRAVGVAGMGQDTGMLNVAENTDKKLNRAKRYGCYWGKRRKRYGCGGYGYGWGK